ncbi:MULTISPECIES: hypothetical protein [unclassified Bacillus (in: firmicutes)]|nr:MULTISPECIES: hypothetical protein [unclassified Bacillus (in: firmicutes)]
MTGIAECSLRYYFNLERLRTEKLENGQLVLSSLDLENIMHIIE